MRTWSGFLFVLFDCLKVGKNGKMHVTIITDILTGLSNLYFHTNRASQVHALERSNYRLIFYDCYIGHRLSY